MSKGVEECQALRTSTCNASTHEGYFFLQGCCVVLLVAWGLSPKHRQVAKDIDVDGSLVMPNQAQHVRDFKLAFIIAASLPSAQFGV